MKKRCTLLILFCATITFSQNNSSNFWNNVRFGGGFGLGFGSSTTIAATPSAIYDFNEKFSMGLGLGYIYNKRDDIKSNIFSGSLISLFNPTNEIQLSGEFEQLFVNTNFGTEENSYNYPALYLGAAYRVGGISVGIRYDVLYDKTKSIYANAISPVIRFYF